MLDDADPVVYAEHFPPPPEDAVTHDVTAALHVSGWVGKANRIYAAYALNGGFIPE